MPFKYHPSIIQNGKSNSNSITTYVESSLRRRNERKIGGEKIIVSMTWKIGQLSLRVRHASGDLPRIFPWNSMERDQNVSQLDGCTKGEGGGACVSIGAHACTRVTRTRDAEKRVNAKSLFNFDRRSCKPRCLAGINPDPVAKLWSYELMMLSCST